MYIESAAIAVVLKLVRAIGVRVALALLRAYLRKRAKRKRKAPPNKGAGARLARRR